MANDYGPLDQLMYVDPRCKIDFDAEDALAELYNEQGVKFGRHTYRCQVCGKALRFGSHEICKTAARRNMNRT